VSELLLSGAHAWARDEAIRAFLRGRPEFLTEDPDLMRALGVRPDAANVVDFGPEALSRVARAHRRESSVRRRLEALAEANFEAAARTHEAVLDLIAADGPADLARRLRRLARRKFGLVAAVLAAEREAPEGWRLLAEGQCDLTLGAARAVRLGPAPTATGLFGEDAPRIGSAALIRLSLGAPARAGVVAFGAEAEDAFHPHMGHELIDFIARAIEVIARRWASS